MRPRRCADVLVRIPNLAKVNCGRGRPRTSQAPNARYVFVLDRVTGEPVWPIEERAVPQTTVPGERTSPTQPFPTRPAPFEHQGISLDGLIDYSPALRAEALAIVAKSTMDPSTRHRACGARSSSLGTAGAASGHWGVHYLNAIDKTTGEFVHRVPIPYSYAVPMTYMADGRQFIVFAWGEGNEAGLTALALGDDSAAVEVEADSRAALASRAPGDLYNVICARCHDTAVQGAPRPGRPGDWELRLARGIDGIVDRTIAGMPPHMPARGLCNECSVAEIRAVVELMLEGVVEMP